VKGFFDWLETKAYKMHVRVFLSRYRSYTTCHSCRGKRLQPESLCFKIDGKSLPELWALPINELLDFLKRFQSSDRFKNSTDSTLAVVLAEITSRLGYLAEVGLGYLTLDRQTRTLSGGEVERVNLTTCLGASLTGTLFVLDEPTVGLHARDIDRLVGIMHSLRDKGNTLVVVEHENTVMRAADHLVDLGPGAGQHGGQIIYQGQPDNSEGLSKKATAPNETRRWLRGEKFIAVPDKRRLHGKEKISIRGATRHNLKKLDVDLPLGLFVCLTGVSGSGKSTLAHDVIHANVARRLGIEDASLDPAPLKELLGTQYLSGISLVDQSPLARTPRSTPALLLGAFEPIRQLFTMTDEARARGLQGGFFSFNSGDGRCDRCAGTGSEQVEMQFLADIHVTCPACNGRRYKSSTLDFTYRGRSIADVLELTAAEIPEAFALAPETTAAEARLIKKIHTALAPLVEVGLGYLKLGQALNTLSGGESQRLKLCQLLGEAPSPSQGTKLIILDEPTTGLHFSDIERLLGVFQKIVDAGHSLLVIEHNLDVIKCADWIIDLGPDAGANGGRLVADGTPEEIAKLKSPTANYLRDALKKIGKGSVAALRSKPAKKSIIPSSTNAITLRGARHHNLKNLSLDSPRDQFVVISGLSGSGKSTLAFDILFAEGQRRFLDSISAYARQFAEQLERPEIDQLQGLPPTVAIEQRVSQGGGKSTVATVTELWNFIRLLYSKLGTIHCPDCQVPVEKQSVAAIENVIRAELKKGDVCLLAPLIRGKKGYHTEIAEWVLKQGFTRLLVDRQFRDAENFTRLERFKEHDIDVVTADLKRHAKKSATDLGHSIERTLTIGKGLIKLFTADKKFVLLSTQSSCPCCNQSFEELDPRLFSFNSPRGWCGTCRGHGKVPKNKRAIVPDTSRFDTLLEAELDADRAMERMDDEELAKCPNCQGSRLNPTASAVRLMTGSSATKAKKSLAGQSIGELSRFSIAEAEGWFSKLSFNDARTSLIARDILPEIARRLAFLQSVGLGYLQLDRSGNTLSGGESQRIRLAAQLGSNLRGVLYVLDEPTIGLHPRDNAALLKTLISLRDQGNSLVVVEHDEDTIAAADHLIDLGPAAGRLGGEVVYQGLPPSNEASTKSKRATAGKKPNQKFAHSPTYRALSHPLIHPLRGERRAVKKNHDCLTIHGCCANNLKNITASIPIGRLTVLTGVSGSGKSTLMHQCIAPIFKRAPKNKNFSKVSGEKFLNACYEVDQSPIGKTSRSCPATYVKVFDHIRALFAQLPESRIRGFDASRFSFNTKADAAKHAKAMAA
jgi:excinuclease ABC subunit A